MRTAPKACWRTKSESVLEDEIRKQKLQIESLNRREIQHRLQIESLKRELQQRLRAFGREAERGDEFALGALRRAAECGDEFANYFLGTAFMDGRLGLPRDNAAAKRHFRKVVESRSLIKSIGEETLNEAKQRLEVLGDLG